MIEVREYVDELGRSRYGKWLDMQDDATAARITKSLTRLVYGNFSNVKLVGEGVSELKIDFGPGFRVYFGREGDKLVILLGGGTKRRQQEDIERAKATWIAYKRRKKAGEFNDANP